MSEQAYGPHPGGEADVVRHLRQTGTDLDDLGCPHCGVACDVCFALDDEVHRLREALRVIAAGDWNRVRAQAGPIDRCVGPDTYAQDVLDDR